MRFVSFSLAPLFACALAASAMAQTAPTTSSTPATPTDADMDQVVCHSMPPPTGSLLGAHRECHTQREWTARQQQAEQEIEKTQRGEQGPASH
jgi:hypothetical protein